MSISRPANAGPVEPEAASERGLDTVRARLEEALEGLGRVRDPKLPLTLADACLGQALREVYTALVARGARDLAAAHLALDRAAEALRTALGALQAAPSEGQEVDGVLAAVAESLGLALSPAGRSAQARPFVGPPTPGPQAPPVPASLDEPVLLDVARPLLDPALPRPEPPDPGVETVAPAPAPAPPPPPASLAELDALMARTEADADRDDGAGELPLKEDGAPVGGAPPPTPSGPEADVQADHARFGIARNADDVLHGRARSLLEDLAMFGLMRRPADIEPWTSSERVELRLLRRLDALVACGTQFLPRLVRELGERPLPDPELTWAHLMVFGSLTGDDALDQVLRLMRATPLDLARMRAALVDALALAPRPEVSGLVRQWLEDSSPLRRAVAVRAAARRGALLPDDFERALGDEAGPVVRAALAVLARVPGPLPTRSLVPFFLHDDERLARPALAGALLRRSSVAGDRVRELLVQGKPAFADAALLVALTGEGDALRDLLAAAGRSTSPVLLHALGWFGHLSAVPLLLDALATGDEGLAPVALASLQRLTGASLTEADPAPRYDDDDLPFTRPRGEPPARMAVLLPDPAAWRSWWAQHGRAATAHGRYRFGQLYAPEDDLWEIASRESEPPLRRLCHIELVARSGGDMFIDRRDFVARQQRQIAGWRDHLARRAERPGSFNSRLTR